MIVKNVELLKVEFAFYLKNLKNEKINTMKLAISTEKEIDSINNFLRECSWLSDEFKRSDFEDLDFEEFEIFKNFDKDDASAFLSNLVRHTKNIFWEKMIFNLQTLLDNCADKSLDFLDFNAEIKRGFKAVELLKEINECLSDEKEIPVFKEKITELLNQETFH